jgi:hypothetical protein
MDESFASLGSMLLTGEEKKRFQIPWLTIKIPFSPCLIISFMEERRKRSLRYLG